MKNRVLMSAALVTVACAALVATAVAAPKAKLFQFRGEVLGTSTTALHVQVEGGNPAALRVLLGQSQDQTFTLGQGTEILVWQRGIPHVASVFDLAQGDEVRSASARPADRRWPPSRPHPPHSSVTTVSPPTGPASRSSSTSAQWAALRQAATSPCT